MSKHLTDLPHHILARIFHYAYPHHLHQFNRLYPSSPCPCPWAIAGYPWRHHVAPLPSALLPNALIARSFATALSTALAGRAIHLDQFAISPARSSWLLVCAPVVESFVARSDCRCDMRYTREDPLGIPRCLANCTFPALIVLDLCKLPVYSAALKDHHARELVSYSQSIVRNLAARIESLALPLHVAFQHAFEDVQFPMLTSFKLTGKFSEPNTDLLTKILADICSAPRIQRLALFNIVAPAVDASDLLMPTVTHLRILHSCQGDCFAASVSPHFAVAFPNLRLFDWDGDSSATVLESFAESCPKLQMISLTNGGQCSTGQDYTSDNFFSRIAERELSHISTACQIVGAQRLACSLRFVHLAETLSRLLRVHLPLQCLEITILPSSLTSLQALCTMYNDSLQQLIVHCPPGFGRDRRRHGQESDLESLISAVTKLNNLKELHVDSLKERRSNLSAEAAKEFTESCLKSMKQNALVFRYALNVFPNALSVLKAHTATLRCIQVHNPNLRKLMLQLTTKDSERNDHNLWPSVVLANPLLVHLQKELVNEVEKCAKCMPYLVHAGESAALAERFANELLV